jgi:citrate lyase beta subunit
MPDVSLQQSRSLLFAPASNERRLGKALASAADAVVADLEDAVAPGEKEQARAVVLRLRPSIVRVNGVGTRWFEDDLAVTAKLELDALMLPKATPQAVAALGPKGPPVIAVVETALGLRLAFETASQERVAALMLGAADLAAEVGLEPRTDGLELLYSRAKLVFDSAAAGIRPPFDVVHLTIDDAEGLEASSRFARSLGYGGKACIHPAQVGVVNRVFAPGDEDIRWAERVVDAFERAQRAREGVTALDGLMIDRPVVERARRILGNTTKKER